MTRYNIFGALVLSAIGAAALAHNGATGVVMERMMGMSAMRDAMRDIAPMMQGQVAYDEMAVQAAAAVLQQHAGETMTQLFPKEAIPAASYARPEIWSNWDRFAALANELNLYADGLALAAPNGLVSATTMTEAKNIMDHGNMPMQSAPKRFSVEELMGVEPLKDAGPAIASPAADKTQVVSIDFEMMAAGDVFEKVGQTCASCHSAFRKGK